MRCTYPRVFALLTLVCALVPPLPGQRCPLLIPSFLDEVRAENAKQGWVESSDVTAGIRDNSAVYADVRIQSDIPLTKDIQREIREIIRRVDDRDSDYTEAGMSEAMERVRYTLQTHGYYKALVGDPQKTVVQSASSKLAVNVFIPIELGDVYRLDEIHFEHATVFSASELRTAFPIRKGDVFNVDKVRIGLDQLRKMYGTKGYINVTPVPDTRVDDARHNVLLNVDLDEGKQFRIGQVKVLGSKPVVERYLSQHRLTAGAVYNSEALSKFFSDSTGRNVVVPGLDQYHDLELPQHNDAGTLDIIIDARRCPQDPEECGDSAPCATTD